MSETKILVIDPDENSRSFLVNLLKKKEYVVRVAESGQDGLQKINEFFPDLITCDASLKDISAEAIIVRLRQEMKNVHTPIVVFSEIMDPEEMDGLIKAGATDYTGKSGLLLMGFLNNIPNLLAQAKINQVKEKKGGLVAFVSAKGGTGTSSLCVNVGTSLTDVMAQSSIAIVDLVLPIGSLALITGTKSPYTIVDSTLEETENLTPQFLRSKFVKPKSWMFHFLPGSPEPGAAANLDVSKVEPIVKNLRKAFDYVLIDLGRSFSRISLPIIKQADVIVLVLSNDLSTVMLTKRTLEYLEKQEIRPSRIYPILNRAVGLEGLSKADSEKILGITIQTTMPYMSSNLTLANNQNLPVSAKFPTDSANLSFKQIAVELSQMIIRSRETGQLSM